jgi:serine/threonine-protein phosphatase 2B catalytic subunit
MVVYQFVSRKFDIANERLPQVQVVHDSGQGSLAGVSSIRSLRENNMEELIRKVFQEAETEAGVDIVEKLADRIARGHKPQGRPRALKRFETA